MMSPGDFFRKISKKWKREWRVAFLAAVVIGLLVHMPAMLSDIPNHDGLDSLYFDQNMITSGRWFLMVACGFSSFYAIPWCIGLLGLFFLGLTAAALTELLEVKKTWAVVAVGGLLATFPALASTFAYVFTLDGYMLAMLLSVLSVLLTKRWRYGFLPGAVCLALSLGTYQAYLAFAMILSVFAILMLAAEQGELREKVKKSLRYLYMGALGVAFYYGMLQLLLKIQGRELAGYQGISDMTSGAASGGLPGIVAGMYRDFAGFSLKGNVLFHNGISLAACVLLALSALLSLAAMAGRRKWWKNPWFFAIMGLTAALLPLVTNIILLISPNVTYHLLMRYQWVLYLIGMAAFVGGRSEESGVCADGLPAGRPGQAETDADEPPAGRPGRAEADADEPPAGRPGRARADVDEPPACRPGRAGADADEPPAGRPGRAGADVDEPPARAMAGYALEWAALAAAFVLVFFYGITDNIGYGNLQKRYEKTYAYCVRLLDRIEQTPGYYQGIPIAMIGVVGDEEYPPTDLTLPVTSGMIGLNGDVLLYTGKNYQRFIQSYLGATLNILPAEAMAEMYYEEEYIDMESFPGKDSIRIIDGIMYIKTENVTR